MTWSPLACGIVSGKYDSGIPPYSRASLKVSTAVGGRGAFGIRMRIQAFLPPVGWGWPQVSRPTNHSPTMAQYSQYKLVY